MSNKLNHFLEIGINDNDTLITVHSGSRNLGGDTFKKWKKIAQQQYKEILKESTDIMLKSIPPKERQEWLLNNKPKPRKIDFVDLSLDERLMDDFEIDYYNANEYALDNRRYMLSTIAQYFELGKKQLNSIFINCTHNYIDFDEKPWVIRKGSIKAVHGDTVIIPINMRDGIIIGDVTERGEFNNSLPHGAGRLLSRTKAFEKLDMEQFKNDMKDVVSSTVVYETLDESPRAYKDINTILDDIGDGLENVRVFKSVFNYKGVE